MLGSEYWDYWKIWFIFPSIDCFPLFHHARIATQITAAIARIMTTCSASIPSSSAKNRLTKSFFIVVCSFWRWEFSRLFIEFYVRDRRPQTTTKNVCWKRRRFWSSIMALIWRWNLNRFVSNTLDDIDKRVRQERSKRREWYTRESILRMNSASLPYSTKRIVGVNRICRRRWIIFWKYRKSITEVCISSFIKLKCINSLKI